MSTALNNEPDRRQQASLLIKELQEERQLVWSLYCKIADLKPFLPGKNIQSMLTEFSQMLIDYVSLGHFGVFQRIFEGNERREAVQSVANEIYPEFVSITDVALEFDEKYSQNQDQEKLYSGSLEKDLSLLGENLANRIDLEDRLCEVMLR